MGLIIQFSDDVITARELPGEIVVSKLPTADFGAFGEIGG